MDDPALFLPFFSPPNDTAFENKFRRAIHSGADVCRALSGSTHELSLGQTHLKADFIVFFMTGKISKTDKGTLQRGGTVARSADGLLNERSLSMDAKPLQLFNADADQAN